MDTHDGSSSRTRNRSRVPATGCGTDAAKKDVADGSLWTASDVATYLQTSRSWVYHQSEAGKLPCLRVGGLLRFDPATVRAFARGESRAPTSVLPFPCPGRR